MLAFVAGITLLPRILAAQPAIEGYADYAALTRQVEAIGRSPLAKVSSLGKTRGGRDVWLIALGSETAAGKRDEKPALLIIGNVHAPHLVGSELAVRIAASLVERAEKEDAVKQLLADFTVYVIPRPTPDASEAFFRKPYHERLGNDRQTDDDRDGEVGEDPAADLDGDGAITMLRVEDPVGKHRRHPNDNRVMIEANDKKNEAGEYTLHVESRDSDEDEKFGEDGASGVAFNHNFPFKYRFFTPLTGPHQVSEVETRAVADFCYSRPNIAAVFTFTPEDNLFHPWKSGDDKGRIRTTLAGEDSPYLELVTQKYREIHGGKDAPAAASGHGSFSQWAYFHYGRWSLASRGWWIPKVAEEKPAEGAEKKPTDSREADALNALRWFKQEGIDGFVPWKPFDHPDLKGKKVEIGGFRPFLTLNPPAKELQPLADRHVKFIRELAELMPKLSLVETKGESVGGGLHRITATVANVGFLPTMSEMGRVARIAYPVQIKLELPEGTKFLRGSPRQEVERLAGRGGKQRIEWLVRLKDDQPATAKVSTYAPAVGTASATLELK